MVKLQNLQTLASRTKNLQAPSLLKLLSSMILWNEGQNQEFERRNWKKSKVFGYGDEEEEEILERESEIRFRASNGWNPVFKTSQLGDKQDADTWQNLADVK